jgi:hypothetical protein
MSKSGSVLVSAEEFVHNARRRGKALLSALVRGLVG